LGIPSRVAKVRTSGAASAAKAAAGTRRARPKSARRVEVLPSEEARPVRTGLEQVEAWFASRRWTPWTFQREAWAAFGGGASGLIEVATGAGKTYAAYMGPLASMIDEIDELDESGGGKLAGVRVLYVTPLRAVTRDIEKALLLPILEMGLALTVEGRTGDTSAATRARQRDRLPNVLVTTPESLSLLLTREKAREMLATLCCVIVDEWHELLCSKRGTQVELALARLRRWAPGVRTWAMSATLPNREMALGAAVGVGAWGVELEEEPAGTAGLPKAVLPKAVVVTGEMHRPIVIESVLPGEDSRLPWAGHLGLSMLPDVVASLDVEVPTIIFTNTRSQSERWFHAIQVLRPEWSAVMALHHGSIERDERERVESGLKDGSLRLVIATSSLDLGVDFSPVERVYQIGSPKGIARIAQRAGRASHRPNVACRILCVPTHALELFEIDAARRALLAGEVEARFTPDKPLDVLAQHLVTCALGGGFVADELFEEVRTAWSYRALTRQEFDWALALVERGGGTLSAYPEFCRVRAQGGLYRVVGARVAQLHRLNVGTIVGDASVDIRYMSGPSLGRIDEGFIAHLKENERFVFAGKVVRFAMFKDLVAYVRPAKGSTLNTVLWPGTRLPISESLAEAIRGSLEHAARGVLDSPELQAAGALVATQLRCSAIPRADQTLMEIAATRDGEHLFVFPFEGRLVHAGIAAVVAMRMARIVKATFATAVNDYGLEILGPKGLGMAELVSQHSAALFSPEQLASDAVESLNMSQLAKSQFREVARVAGLVFENGPGSRKSARHVSASSSLLFDVLTEFDPENLLLLQARREVLEKHFEQGRLARTMMRVAGSEMLIVRTERLTPLAFPLVVERQSATLSSETIADQVRRMRAEWENEA
jgi:ATP-dependent helicase Lhr and Lhr-like helicase